MVRLMELMKIFKTKNAIKIFFLCPILFVNIACLAQAAEPESRLAQCAQIENNVDRLKCYDELAGKKNAPAAADLASVIGDAAAKESPSPSTEQSVMTKLWDLDPKNRKRSFVLVPYRSNYFLPVAYNSSPNQDTALDFDPDARANYNEAKFQLSFKAKLWEDLFDQKIDIWLAYTQLAFWQLYNTSFSSPFRDTNYEPELLFNYRSDYEFLGFKGRFINVGLNHQSNGRSAPLSRSWNRVVANAGLEKGDFGLLLKSWYRIPDDASNDDNPDIATYMGYGELWGTYYFKQNRFAIMLRNNLRQENLGAVQLEWCLPLSLFYHKLDNRFSLYFQYFNGYGEGLLDYDKSINRFSVGFILSDWN
jgi:phospholipase A1